MMLSVGVIHGERDNYWLSSNQLWLFGLAVFCCVFEIYQQNLSTGRTVNQKNQLSEMGNYLTLASLVAV